MLKKVEISCPGCEAVFSVLHDMDEESYRVQGCPFCLDEITDPEEMNIYEYDEDEETWVLAN